MKGLIRNGVWLAGCTLVLASVGCATTGNSCGTAACGAGAGACATGCGHNGLGGPPGCPANDNNLFDRCYPQRYSHIANKAVNVALTPQVQNGRVLDQTVWNSYFEPGTDRLTVGGQEQLAYMARRRPQPDTTVYLQTANDLSYDPGCPDRFAGMRQELDGRRVASVQKYLTAYTAGRPTDFHVLVHDPANPSLPSQGPASSVIQSYGQFRGGVATGGGAAGATSGTSSGGSTSGSATGGR